MMNKRIHNDSRGITLIEVLVSLGIFSLLAMSVAWILITSVRQNAILWEQLATQTDGRRVLREVVDVARRAEESSIGSYPIATSDEYEFTFYANIDADSFRERVRFFLDDNNNTFNMGTIKPSGNPLSYNPGNEVTVTLANAVVNADEGEPVFTYFDESYDGTNESSAIVTSVADVRVVRVQLELEEDPTATPVPLHIESTVNIRNLKTN